MLFEGNFRYGPRSYLVVGFLYMNKKTTEELWNLSNGKFLSTFAKDEADTFYYLKDDKEKGLAYKITEYGDDLANDGWGRGKKEGMIQGLFLGALISFFLTIGLLVPFHVKYLKEDVLDCLSKISDGYSVDSVRECVEEGFDNAGI